MKALIWRARLRLSFYSLQIFSMMPVVEKQGTIGRRMEEWTRLRNGSDGTAFDLPGEDQVIEAIVQEVERVCHG